MRRTALAWATPDSAKEHVAPVVEAMVKLSIVALRKKVGTCAGPLVATAVAHDMPKRAVRMAVGFVDHGEALQVVGKRRLVGIRGMR